MLKLGYIGIMGWRVEFFCILFSESIALIIDDMSESIERGSDTQFIRYSMNFCTPHLEALWGVFHFN